MPIKSVLMDIGGVVLVNTATEEDFANFAEIFGAKIGVDSNIINEVRKLHLRQSMTGGFSSTQFFSEVGQKSNTKLPENIEQIWIDTIAPEIKINQPLLDWVNKTREKCNVVVFSTISSLRLPIDQKLGIYDYFDDVFLSIKEGMTKSNPQFFKIALNKLDIRPEQALLIDDQPINISRAIAQGINGFEYKPYYYTKPELFSAAISAYDL